jgi:hypothetical protein
MQRYQLGSRLITRPFQQWVLPVEQGAQELLYRMRINLGTAALSPKSPAKRHLFRENPIFMG